MTIVPRDTPTMLDTTPSGASAVGQARALLDVQFEERFRQLAARDQGARPRAAALLVPEDGDRPAAGPLDRLDRGDDAERAVELAALRNRVEV